MKARPSHHVLLLLIRLENHASHAIPTLVELLAHPDQALREQAIWALTQVRATATQALSATQRALRDESPLVRYWAALLLGSMAPDSLSAVPALLERLDPGEHSLPLVGAAVALVKLGSSLNPVIEALQQRREEWDSQTYAFKEVLAALGERGQEARVAELLLRDGLRGESGGLRIAAACALLQIVGPDRSALTTLQRELTEESYVEDALEGLTSVGRAADELVAQIEPHLSSERRDLRVKAAQALWRITGAGSASLPALVEAISANPDPVSHDEQVLAIEVLGEIGPAAREAVPTLEAALASPSHSVRQAAGAALEKIRAETRG